jgi:Na+-driven multidrug efflux pump
MYNIVDRIYIGHSAGGRLALTGIGITLPIISILIGFANLCGTGGAPLCSMARGRGDIKKPSTSWATHSRCCSLWASCSPCSA